MLVSAWLCMVTMYMKGPILDIWWIDREVDFTMFGGKEGRVTCFAMDSSLSLTGRIYYCLVNNYAFLLFQIVATI